MNVANQEKPAGAVSVSARYYFPVPKTRAGRLAEGGRHTQKPDLDNLIKTLDGLTGVAWHDDCSVAEIHASKYWTYEQARAELEVEEL